MGPLLSVVLFSLWQGYTIVSEEWPMNDLRIVILVGLTLEDSFILTRIPTLFDIVLRTA